MVELTEEEKQYLSEHGIDVHTSITTEVKVAFESSLDSRYNSVYTFLRDLERTMTDVTRILNAIEQGDLQATEKLLPLVYEKLRILATQKMAQEPPGQTLQATALVHEAYVRLVETEYQNWKSRNHFFMAAAEAMRRILVENARQKKTLKRGGHRQRVGLDQSMIPANEAVSSISADGRMLFFSSALFGPDRPGGYGDFDIWVATRATVSDPWAAPVNLGPMVNSSDLEVSPNISADGSTLYFSSNRPGGSGNRDLWQVSIDPVVDLNGDGSVDAADIHIMAD